MGRIRHSFTIWVFAVVILTMGAPAKATTLSEVLGGIMDARNPASLTSLSFLGDMRLELDTEGGGLLPEQASLLSAWRAPDEWFCSYETSGELAGSVNDPGGGHPAVNHVLLSRPDFLDIINFAWSAQYQGTAMWEGEPAWQLLFSTRDLTLNYPSYNLYVRKDDFVPLRASVEFADGTTALTDLTWIVLEGVVVPGRFTTVFNPPIGPLSGYETTYFNHDINPDLSGIDFPREEGTLLTITDPTVEEGPSGFEELYHGFADDPMIATISDSSGTYDRISFTFSLYVEDGSVPGELDRHREAIRSLAVEIVSGWEWSGDSGLSSPGGKYECGGEIRDAIGELLGTDTITDFYFLEFEPLEPGE